MAGGEIKKVSYIYLYNIFRSIIRYSVCHYNMNLNWCIINDMYTHYITFNMYNTKENFRFLELETMIIIWSYKVKTLHGPPVNDTGDNIYLGI